MYFIFLRSIPLNSYSSAFSWPVIKDTSFTCRCEFGSCRMHFPQTAALTHIHETRRFSSHLPWEVFYYNNQPALPTCVNGISPLGSTVLSHKKKREDAKDKVRKLACEICNKTFLRPSALRVVHVNILAKKTRITLTTILDKTVEKIAFVGVIFSKLRSRPILPSPSPPGSNVVGSSKESRIPMHL